MQCYTLDHDVHAVVSNRNHTNVIFVTFTECPYTCAANGRQAPSQPRSPDGVAPYKFIEVGLSKASEWSRLHHYVVHLGHFHHRMYKYKFVKHIFQARKI